MPIKPDEGVVLYLLSRGESMAEEPGCEVTLESPGKREGVTAAVTFPFRP